MDPVFGLPVVKESRAMECARNRNRTQQRRLGTQISKLHSKLHDTTSRIIQNKNTALDLWSTIHPPPPEKSVVCPTGLTNQEKSVYKHIHKSGAQSMSLKEFDIKMEEFRNQSSEHRGKDKMNSPRRRRRNSESVTTPRRGSIVPDEEQIGSPLPTRKHRMKAALERLETADVRVKDKNMNDQYKSASRRNSSVLPSLPRGNSTTKLPRRNSVAVTSLETPVNERLLSSSSDEGKQTLEDVKTLMGQLAIT